MMKTASVTVDMLARKVHSLRASVHNRLATSVDVMERGGTVSQRDHAAAHVLKWGQELFESAAKLTVYSSALTAITGHITASNGDEELADAALAGFIVLMQREVVSASGQGLGQSTMVTSDLMDQAIASAQAKLIAWVLDEEFASL